MIEKIKIYVKILGTEILGTEKEKERFRLARVWASQDRSKWLNGKGQTTIHISKAFWVFSRKNERIMPYHKTEKSSWFPSMKNSSSEKYDSQASNEKTRLSAFQWKTRLSDDSWTPKNRYSALLSDHKTIEKFNKLTFYLHFRI